MDKEMTLKEAASALAVSQATVRNWLKVGRLLRQESNSRGLRLNRSHVLALKEEIASGAVVRLQSRRNKRSAKGNATPMNYVNQKACNVFVEELLGIFERLQLEVTPPMIRLILTEIALHLLVKAGKIPGAQVASGSGGLIRQMTEGKLPLDTDSELFNLLGDVSHDVPATHTILLQEINSLIIPYVPGEDLLGLIYMTLSNLGTRKKGGAYYTPRPLVEDLVDESLRYLGRTPKINVLDPCCGSGNFLIRLFSLLVDKVEKEEGLSRSEAEGLVLTQRLSGYDNDPVAVALSRINLILLMEGTCLPQNREWRIQCCDTLARDADLISGDPGGSPYDLIIGNPPWGYAFKEEDLAAYRSRYQVAWTSKESFAFFIEYGLQSLKNGGILAYVLPEALLYVTGHSNMRKHLLDHSQILQISLLGNRFPDVFTPTITLQTRKASGRSKPPARHLLQAIVGSHCEQIPQQRFQDSPQATINIRTTNREDQLLRHMKNLPGVRYLAGNADFALGIVTGNNQEFILKEYTTGTERVLKGNDIFKYNYYPGEHYLFFKPDVLQQVAPESLYRNREKLVYRFINESLVFAYDESRMLSLNSANQMTPRLKGYATKFLLALLNSRPAQFFHTASFFSIKVLRQHIESIPIPPCEAYQQERIVSLTEALLQTLSPEVRLVLYEEIDKLVMDLYRLSPEQRGVIKDKHPKPKYL